MSEPVTTPFTDARPGLDPAGQAGAAATLATLQARVRKLLLAGHWNSASPLPRLAKQLNVYTHAVERALWVPPKSGLSVTVDARSAERPPITSLRFQEEAEALIEAIDALIADPDNAALSNALEEIVQRIGGTLPRGPGHGSEAKPTPSPDPAAMQEPRPAPTDQPTLGAPLVELHRLDTAERHWWEAQHEALRRRTDLALLLAVITIAGLGAMLLGGGAPPPTSPPEANPGAGTGQAPAVADPTSPPRSPVLAADGPLALLSGMTADEVRALLQLPGRFSELDLAVLRLDARLAALEAQQVALDRARNLAPVPSPTPKPAVPGYGLRLAILKDPTQVQRFIEEHGIDPRQVRVVKTGKRVLLIHGLFADRAQADAAIPNLPQSLRRQNPSIHAFAPGETPAPLAGGDQPLTTDH